MRLGTHRVVIACKLAVLSFGPRAVSLATAIAQSLMNFQPLALGSELSPHHLCFHKLLNSCSIHRKCSPLFSQPYKTLPQQTLSFDNLTKAPGVYPLELQLPCFQLLPQFLASMGVGSV